MTPSNTMSLGPRPTSIPSGIVIHPTVWPQYTRVTDRERFSRSRSVKVIDFGTDEKCMYKLLLVSNSNLYRTLSATVSEI